MLIHMGKEIENGKFYGKLKKVEKGLLRGRGDHAEGDILAGSGGVPAGGSGVRPAESTYDFRLP